MESSSSSNVKYQICSRHNIRLTYGENGRLSCPVCDQIEASNSRRRGGRRR